MNGPLRWFSLSLVVLGCAGAVVTLRALSTSTERGRPSPVEAAAVAEVEPASRAPSAIAVSPSQREALGQAESDTQLARRVQDVTAQLAQALLAPEFEDERWRVEVETRASTLGRAALPALRSLLADRSLTTEEYVAAHELTAALEAR